MPQISGQIPAGPKSVLEIIYEWSRSKPLWQRDALRRIISAGTLGDDDITVLTRLCKKDRGAGEIKDTAIALAEDDLPANPGASESISLIALKDVSGVNQLAAQQTLPIASDGITIIYGNNGAGKSGYARILKRACRARYPGEIMPDAYGPSAPQAQALIELRRGVHALPPVDWRNETKPHPILSAISVFDRECGAVHLREKNEVFFRPFGLDIPDDLADACQRVKNLLQTELTSQEAAKDAAFIKPAWKPDGRVGKLVEALTASSTLTEISKLASVSEEERTRHQRLNEDLARDPLQASAEQTLLAEQIGQLHLALGRIESDTSDDRLTTVHQAALDARTKRTAARLAAEGAFSAAQLPGVGGEVWKVLWDAARHYSEHVGYVGKLFPPEEGDPFCVLCHQPLTSEALVRLGSFEQFVQADAERQAVRAESEFRKAAAVFEGKRVRIHPLGLTRRRVALIDPALGKRVLRFLAAARIRYVACQRTIEGTRNQLELPSSQPCPRDDLLYQQVKAVQYAEELRLAADSEGRKKLEAERDILADRIALAGAIPSLEGEIERLRTIKLLKACIADTNTNGITRLGNDIADTVITPGMRDRFHEEIVRLAAHHVRVEIERAGGRYGSPNYRIKLIANAKAQVHNVLSEGEQTCVALAAFMTELATAAHQSALVFDDPVTSLDHRWRNKVAQRLAEEAAVRQIIVFTHDLAFLDDLRSHAEKQNKTVQLVTLSRTSHGAGTVTVGLPWMAASVAERVDMLEKDVRAAKPLYESQDEEAYAHAAHRIYSRLRAAWERGIEDIAFNGVINRHRDYINTKNLKKTTALTEADCNEFDTGFKRCCDQIDAHDSSRGRNAAPPSPDEMMNDVQAVLTWAKNLRLRQKAMS